MFRIFQQHLLYLCIVPVSLEWQICLQMVRISLFMVVKIVGFKYQKLINRMFDLFYFFLSSMSCLLMRYVTIKKWVFCSLFSDDVKEESEPGTK